MKKTYIAPEAQVYTMNANTPMFLSVSGKKADDSEVLSNRYWGNDNIWSDEEEEETEQTSLY